MRESVRHVLDRLCGVRRKDHSVYVALAAFLIDRWICK